MIGLNKLTPLIVIAFLMLVQEVSADLRGEDITAKEGEKNIYVMSVDRCNPDYPERLKFKLKVNEAALSQHFPTMEWVFSDVIAWDLSKEKPEFIFNFPIVFSKPMDGWQSATFEVSEKLALHGEVTLYCVSRSSTSALNAHIKLAAHLPGKKVRALRKTRDTGEGKQP